VTGRCAYYSRRGIDRRHETSGVQGDRGTNIEHTLEIRRSPAVLYAFWRDFERLPNVMRHVKSVRRLSERRSHWEVKAPLGQTVEWEAEIINDVPNTLIAWQTLPGSTVRNAGSVWFEPTESGTTNLKVALQFDSPSGIAGTVLASALGSSPQRVLVEDLESFKEFAERELAPFGT
jgi:uncharacterized membrane protein